MSRALIAGWRGLQPIKTVFKVHCQPRVRGVILGTLSWHPTLKAPTRWRVSLSDWYLYLYFVLCTLYCYLESRRVVGMYNATSAVDDQGVAFATPLAGPGGLAVGPPETGGEVILFNEAVHSETPIQSVDLDSSGDSSQPTYIGVTSFIWQL